MNQDVICEQQSLTRMELEQLIDTIAIKIPDYNFQNKINRIRCLPVS